MSYIAFQVPKNGPLQYFILQFSNDILLIFKQVKNFYKCIDESIDTISTLNQSEEIMVIQLNKVNFRKI